MTSQPSFVIDIQLDSPLPDMAETPEQLRERLETAVLLTLQQEQVSPPAMLTLLLTDDEQLRQLNRDFRQLDEPTDVLSFPAGDPLPGSPETTSYLGDIAISIPYVMRQAAASGHRLRYGHSFVAELQLLTIHAVLHLLGHEHDKPKQKETMWAAQAAVLAQLGLEKIVPPES